MLLKLVVTAFLLAHAGIHASFLSPRPPVTAGGPEWPFELGRSWILSPLGISSEVTRILGIALIAVLLAAYALSAIAAVGIAPTGVWVPAVVAGSVASIALLGLFFHPWLTLGIAIDVVLLWAALVAGWTPERLG